MSELTARLFGDPEVDAVDWIESIPFTETRDYVQRVLEGVQVYRWRLGQARTCRRWWRGAYDCCW